VYMPHFHLIGYGWVINTNKISKEGWVIKNKGIRDSSTQVYNTVAYLLSHTGIAKGVHSVTWFGDLSYSAKYAFELKQQKEENDYGKCPYCSQYLVLFEIKGLDRPPPDQEWSGLFDNDVAYSVETVDEMLDRKIWVRKKLEKTMPLVPDINMPMKRIKIRNPVLSLDKKTNTLRDMGKTQAGHAYT